MASKGSSRAAGSEPIAGPNIESMLRLLVPEMDDWQAGIVRAIKKRQRQWHTVKVLTNEDGEIETVQVQTDRTTSLVEKKKR